MILDVHSITNGRVSLNDFVLRYFTREPIAELERMYEKTDPVRYVVGTINTCRGNVKRVEIIEDNSTLLKFLNLIEDPDEIVEIGYAPKSVVNYFREDKLKQSSGRR